MPGHAAGRLHGWSVALLLASAAVSSPIRAGSEPLSSVLGEASQAGLGFVIRTEASPYLGENYRNDLLPLYLYTGKRFFLHADRAGVTLFDDPETQLDLFLSRRLEGFAEDQIPEALAGMAARNTGADLGLVIRHHTPWGEIRGTVLRDIENVSSGTEVRLGYARTWQSGRWRLRPDLSLNFRDAALNNYYYGVSAAEANGMRPAYAPGAGLDIEAGLYGSYQLLPHWQLLGGLALTWLDADIRNSPIVNDRLQPHLALGAAYDFGTPGTAAGNGDDPLRIRVFHGMASADGCHLVRILSLRCLNIDRDNPTSITGVHIGRPFQTRVRGWPLDFHAYAGLLYRNENGLQRDAWQVDAYMKALYYGFPWRNKLMTRLGFGFGISYAQRIPSTEALSQAERGRPASRLLNYLDPSIDIRLGDLLRSPRLADTYFGFGVSHRSGIFASSRLLGNVNGGSNYIYTYLESGF